MKTFKRRGNEKSEYSKGRKPPFYRIEWVRGSEEDIRPALFLMREGFRMSSSSIAKLTEEAEKSGRAVLGVFCPDIARSKMAVAEAAAGLHKLPFPFLLKRE